MQDMTPRRSLGLLVALVIGLLGYWFIGLLTPQAVSAANERPMDLSPYWQKDTRDFAKSVNSGDPNEVNFDKYSSATTMNPLNSIGYGILDPTGQNNFTAVNSLGSAIAALTKKPPVQTGEYIAYMAGKAGFVDTAYAASSGRGGYDVLQPIQKLWVATRNVAYLITSLVLVVIGFMIMLRKKIDAQTVVGIQQALPNLVVTLLLITFSYAIAGFIIDMIYFLTFFGIKLLALNGVFSDAGNATLQTITTKSIFNIGIRDLFRIGGTSTGNAETAADAIGNLVDSVLGGKLGEALGVISQPIAFVIIAVAILFAVFKLFFSLLMAYIQIILLAILGPLQLMLNALPGSDAFGKWFRNILANAMAFPAAALMLVFSAALMGQTNERWKISDKIGFTDTTSGVNWVPPLLFGGDAGSNANSVDAIVGLLGIGILLMTPKVVDMVKEALQAPEFKYGSAIGEAVGFGWGGAKNVAGRGYGATYGYNREMEIARNQARADFITNRGRPPEEGELDDIMQARYPHGRDARTEDIRRRLGKFFGSSNFP